MLFFVSSRENPILACDTAKCSLIFGFEEKVLQIDLSYNMTGELIVTLLAFEVPRFTHNKFILFH